MFFSQKIVIFKPDINPHSITIQLDSIQFRTPTQKTYKNVSLDLGSKSVLLVYNSPTPYDKCTSNTTFTRINYKAEQ